MIPRRTRIFFGCEGKDERSYGQYLRRLGDEQNLHIHINTEYPTPGGGDPLEIVENCVKLMKRNQRRRGDYLHKVILLDSDTLGKNRKRDQQIDGIIDKESIQLIYSNPNFEALILRHLPECGDRQPVAKNALADLQKEWPQYKHGKMTALQLHQKLGIEGLKRATMVENELCKFVRSIGFKV
ncbi:MAG: RloB domain-containing protein [Gammaproteobacteria bacterium]